MEKEIVLQNMLFPSEEICNEMEMYFKGHGFNLENNTIIFENDGLLTASTYFNSFSLDKWKKYTGIKDLKISFLLKGDFVIRLCSMQLVKDRVEIKVLSESVINVSEISEINLDFDIRATGIVYYEINAKSDGSELYKSSYITSIVDREVNAVNIAIGICTFKREEFIVANLNRLNVGLNDPENVLYGKVKVFVADNGQTLPLDELNNENIHIVYNKNLGGAGGFTRSLIEAKRYSQEFTNFIFLDDDIVLSVAAIEKEVVFLSLLLPEYHKSVIGGAMFSTDKRYLQFESAAKWERTGFVFNRRDIDLRDNINILLNEEPYDMNYNAWCCCCIPFDIVTEANLPLPIFFHMDDVEYGLRNKLPIITLNGINVWHLYKKQLVNAKNDYYDIRNKLIMLSGVMPDSVIPMAYTYLASFTNEVLKYHYARAINAFDGILDFLKGFEWFKNLDTQQKHGKLYNNVKWQKADDKIVSAAHISLADGKGKKYKLKVALKQILPSTKKRTVVINENGLSDAASARSVAVYVPSERQYILYKKNRRLELKCLYKHYKIASKLKKIQPVINEYHNRLPEVQSINFWDKYLGLQTHDKRKKVLFVASDNDATSGAFRSMVVLNYILKREYKLDTCVLLPNDGDGYKLLKEKGLRYTTIETVDWIVTTDSNKRQIKDKKKKIKEVNGKALSEIIRFMKDEKFDIVHINTSYTYMAAIAAQKLNIPIVWHIREFLEEDQSRMMVDKEYGLSLMRKADAIVAISKAIYKKYNNLLHVNNLKQIYNGIAVNDFLCEDKEIFESEKITLICVGTIEQYKGQLILVEALHKLKESGFSNFELLLVGHDKTQYGDKLKKTVEEYGMRDNVKILGRRHDVAELYKQCDITCVCSRSEAFGRTTVEAMLSGCLLIGANTAGTRELINDESDGLLFEAENAQSLYEKTKYALDNRKMMKELAANGRDKAFKEFSADKNAKEVYYLYSTIWERRK